MRDAETRTIDHEIWRILIPLILQNGLMTVSNMVTTGYIGRLAVTEISAFGIANRIFNLYYSVFTGLAIGIMIVSAKAFGSGSLQRCRKLQEECYDILMPAAVLLAALIAVFPSQCLRLMTADAELIRIGSGFLRLICIGMPFIAMTSLNASAFQARGDTRTPLRVTVVGNAINIIAGYILIFGLGSFHGFGLIGAGIAQILNQIIMCLLGLWLLYSRSHGLFRGELKEPYCLHPDRRDVSELLNTGVPAALEFSFWQVATVVVSRTIISYGQPYYAAYQIGIEAEGLCDMMSTGFVTASMTMASIAIGRGDSRIFRAYYKRLKFLSALISIFMSLFLAVLGGTFSGMLTDKPQLIAISISYLQAMVWSQLPQNCSKIMFGYLRTSGHEKMPMVLNFLGIWLVRVPLVLLFGNALRLPIVWLWWAINADQWSRFLLGYFFMRKMKILSYVERQGGASSSAA